MKQKQYKVNTRTKGEREQKIKVKNQEVFEDSGPYAHAKMERRALPNGMPTGKGYHFSGKRAR
uniref:Uncharacterized protein n=1 Tax=Arundo donax TaxID=35708 RepID=A0A0A9AXL6_ARUDO